MNLSMPVAVTSRVARTILIGRKHSPTILFAGGVVGVVATTVSACKATLKLEEVLEETQANLEIAKTLDSPKYSESDRKKDIAHLYIRGAMKVCKLYAPSFALGALSIAALTGSHNILSKRNAGLTAAYAAVEKGFRDYRNRVVTEYGEDKDREFRYGTETKTVVVEETNGPKKKNMNVVGDGGGSMYSKLFDESNQNWCPQPEYNIAFLRTQQNYANDRLRARGHIFLNEVYDLLGFDHTPAGSQVGWVMGHGGNEYVDFGIWNDESMSRFLDFVSGREGCLWIDFNVDGVMWDKI